MTPNGTAPRKTSTENGTAPRAPKDAPSKAPPQTSPDTTKNPAQTTDRNIDKVVLGDICFRTWYPSYYNKDVLGDAPRPAGGPAAGGGSGKAPKKAERDASPVLDRLYVCPRCFKYSKELVTWLEHVRVCESGCAVPGRKIYAHPRAKREVPEANGKGKRRRGEAGATVSSVEDEGEWSVWEVDGAKDGVCFLIPLHCNGSDN